MNAAGIVFPRPFWGGEGGGREVLTLAYPLILSQMSFTVQVFVDRLFLTWSSAEAVAGAVTGLFVVWAVKPPSSAVCAGSSRRRCRGRR